LLDQFGDAIGAGVDATTQRDFIDLAQRPLSLFRQIKIDE